MKECYKRQRHYIMIKGSIQKEDLTIINIYAPNIEAPQHVKQILTNIKAQTDSNMIMEWTLIPQFHQWTDDPNRKSIRKLRP